MIEVKRKSLHKCYLCGKENPKMYKNAAGKFTIRCADPDCRGRTRWLNKDDAICEWYLLFLHGSMQKRKVQALVNEQRQIELADMVRKEANNLPKKQTTRAI